MPKGLIKLTSIILLLALLLAATLTTVAASPPSQTDQTIIEVLTGDGRFTTLLAAIKAADLTDTLEGEGPFTLFAPTDEAFNKLPDVARTNLLSDPAILESTVRYHVVAGNLTAEDIAPLDTATTLLEQPLAIAVNEETISINNATVTMTDIEAANGVIHVIDTVLLPPGVEGVIMTGVVDDLIEGEALIPTDQQKITEFILENDQFGRLALFMQTANFTDTLNQAGPFTLFAPIDNAFAQLPQSTVDSLIADPETLGSLLRYHVAPREILDDELVTLTETNTLLDQPLPVATENEMLNIGEAQIVTSGINVANGVIYGIDTVLQPPAGSLAGEGTLVEGVLVDCATQYVVQDDDWLSKIADKFYGDPLAYPAIFDATNAVAQTSDSYEAFDDPNRIEVGQTLCVPSQEDAEALLFEDVTGPDPIEQQTIFDTVKQREDFDTLVTALETAGLTDTLQGEGPFTLFAPSDRAFERLPVDERDSLLSDPQNLKIILSYHVIPGEFSAAEIRDLDSVVTALDQLVSIGLAGGVVKIGEANLVDTDIQAANGVIHVIDQVLFPPNE